MRVVRSEVKLGDSLLEATDPPSFGRMDGACEDWMHIGFTPKH